MQVSPAVTDIQIANLLPQTVVSGTVEPVADKNASTVRAGDTVILDMSDGKQAFVKLKKTGASAKVGKGIVSLDQLPGAEYGSLFEVSPDGRRLEQVQRPPDVDCEDWMSSTVVDRNNSQLEDAGAAHQQLSSADIAALRQSGKTGEEIVAALLENSSTYSGKTKFSQEKYRRKKAKKYVQHVTLRRTTARSVCETYFAKTPAKIAWLRPDTLALLLSLANIGAHAQVLLIDSTSGLVTAAVAERMGGHGSITVAHVGDRPSPSDLLEKFNLDAGVKQIIRRHSVNDLLTMLQDQGTAPAAQDAGQSTTEPLGGIEAHGRSIMPVGTDPQPEISAAALDGSEPVIGAAHEAQPMEGVQAAGEAGCPENVPSMQGLSNVLHAEVAQPHLPGASSQPEAVQTLTLLTSAALHPEVATAAAVQISAAAVEPSVINSPLLSSGPLAAPGASPVTAAGLETPIPSATSAAIMPSPAPSVPAEQVGHAPSAAAGSRREEGLIQRVRRGFDCSIIAAPNVRPDALLGKVLPLLAPSAAFAVFSNWSQPLAEAMYQLQVSKAAINLQLQESWFREQQVLPGRTHPQMTMSATGGYILSGIKVLP